MEPILVLAVEDNPDQTFFIERAARVAGGFTLLTAMDGSEALTLLRRRERLGAPPPAAIITDLNMPVMDGFELLEQLNTWSFTRDVLKVVLTCSDLAADRAAAETAGIDAYIPKPLTLEKLVHFFRELPGLIIRRRPANDRKADGTTG